jgi:hypothetical protein
MIEPPPLPKYVVEKQQQNLLKKDNPSGFIEDVTNSGKIPSYNDIRNTLKARHETEREKPLDNADKEVNRIASYLEKFRNGLDVRDNKIISEMTPSEKEEYSKLTTHQTQARYLNELRTKKSKIKKEESLKQKEEANFLREQQEYENLFKQTQETGNEKPPTRRKGLYGGRKKKTRSKKHKKKSRSSRKK